jgi:hypothetical protein
MPLRPNQPRQPRTSAGFLEVELVVALAVLMIAVLPLAYTFVSDQRALRVAYERAAAMQLVDGEMETLVAGGWRQYSVGTHEITLAGNAAANLPTQRALLTVNTHSIRLEWRTAKRPSAGIIREAKLP